MPEITGVRERRGKARVFVDGEFWAEIDASVAAQRGLREGLEIGCGELDRLRGEGERALALARALSFLGYRARSEKEVRERLRRYGYGEETIAGTTRRLTELGYLDDEDFARLVAREKARRYGPRRILGELRRSGVGEELAREAVEAEFAERSELEEARSLAARRYNGGGSDAQQARRVYGFLVRRGYSSEVCAAIAREYREASGGR